MIVEITQAQIDAMALIRDERYREDIETLVTRNGETITIDTSTKEYRAIRAKYQKRQKSYRSQPPPDTSSDPLSPLESPIWYCGCHACQYRLKQEQKRPCWLKNQQSRAVQRNHPLGITCESGRWGV